LSTGKVISKDRKATGVSEETSNMNTGKEAEKIVLEYFKRRKIELVKHRRGERGFDFRTKDSKLFVEVKGSAAGKVPFRRFTNAEYEKAKECLLKKRMYEIHLVLGVGTRNCRHYKISAKVFIEKAKCEILWSLPIGGKISNIKSHQCS